MQSLERIRRSISAAEDLGSVAKMMKALAAANIRQFEAAVVSLAEYSRTVELGLQLLLKEQPERLARGPAGETTRLGVVIFGSDQGMCGRFNRQIADHAARTIESLGVANGNRTILIVGTRIVGLLETAGVSVDEQVSPATSLAGIAPLVQELLGHIEEWRIGGGLDRVVLFYNEVVEGSAYRPHTHQLFPVDLEWLGELQRRDWPSHKLPMHTMGWESLFASLVREHLYISLFRASAESLAGENASRLASMQAAERNIEDRLDELNMQFRLRRQHSITEELLEIIAGFEALSAGPG